MTLQTINSFLAQNGLLCIFIIVLLEYMNLPGFPAGIILPAAGIWTSATRSSLFMALLVSVAAGLIGSILLYLLGLYGGEFFIDKYTKRFPKHKASIDKAFDFIRRKGNGGLFISKLIPMVRTIISIPAGVIRMDFKEYIFYSALGILLWNGGFIAAGYFLGEKAFQLLG